MNNHQVGVHSMKKQVIFFTAMFFLSFSHFKISIAAQEGFQFQELPIEMQGFVVAKLSELSTLERAIQDVRNMRLVNKKWAEFINTPQFTNFFVQTVLNSAYVNDLLNNIYKAPFDKEKNLPASFRLPNELDKRMLILTLLGTKAAQQELKQNKKKFFDMLHVTFHQYSFLVPFWLTDKNKQVFLNDYRFILLSLLYGLEFLEGKDWCEKEFYNNEKSSGWLCVHIYKIANADSEFRKELQNKFPNILENAQNILKKSKTKV
jgi:hypothetical protein